ncbi:MAG: mevalonate kinase family protein [Thermoguttaceae bacterium]
MTLITQQAFARAGLLGNPSDGYHGKVISAIVRNFSAKVTLSDWDLVHIVANRDDERSYRSVNELVQDVKTRGYYGGIRLIKAAIKGFVEYCRQRQMTLHDKNFSIQYETTIPRQVGLAGSSAIIVATMRALMEFYGRTIPKRVLPSLVLSIEREELGIPAGLQDRVIQVYEGAVYMDFSQMEFVDGFLCGRYEVIDPENLPPLYVGYSSELGEPTEIFHNNLRQRFNSGELAVVDAMKHLAELAQKGKTAIEKRDSSAFSRMMNENFDIRRSICKIPQDQIEMVEHARKSGVSAKFTGSGGAIVGLFETAEQFKHLQEQMQEHGYGCVEVLV